MALPGGCSLQGCGGEVRDDPDLHKEQAHRLQPDFTQHDLCEDRDRRRLLGNSWRKGVASFLFGVVLKHGVFVVPTAEQAASASAGVQAKSRHEAIECAHALQLPLTRVKRPTVEGVSPPLDMWEHWRSSCRLTPLALQQQPLETALEVVLDILSTAEAGSLAAYRQIVLSGIETLVSGNRSLVRVSAKACGTHLSPHRTSAFSGCCFP